MTTVMLVMLGAGLYQSRIEKTYTSTVTVTIDTVLSDGDKVGGTPGVSIDPLLVGDPNVVQTVAGVLGVPADQIAGRVTAAASSTGGSVALTATASSPSAAQQLANAYAGAMATGVKSQIDEYVAGLGANLDRIKGQLAALQTGSGSEVSALNQAEQSVYTEQYSAAFKYLAAVTAVTEPVIVSGSAPPGSLSSLPLLTVLEVAFVAGLLAGIGLALLRYWLDGRVIDASDARVAADLPVVGSLPVDSTAARTGRPSLISSDSGDSAILEDIRRMRTAISSTLGGTPRGAVIVVTGTVEGDGASFVAANLAAAAARSGSTTIVASGDIRKPDLSEYFGIVSDVGSGGLRTDGPRTGRRRRARSDMEPPSAGGDSRAGSDVDSVGSLNGATNGSIGARRTGLRPRLTAGGPLPPATESGRVAVAEGNVDVPSRPSSLASGRGGGGAPRLVSTSVDGLSLLPSLVGVGADVDALASERVRDLINTLRARADLVIIDASALFEYADPLILANSADAVLLVCRSRRTRTRDLSRAAGILRESGLGVRFCVVVNRVKRGGRRLAAASISPAPTRSDRRRPF